MPAYLIVNIMVENAELYEGYKQLAPATLEAFGARYLVRGGPIEVLEGDWKLERVVVLEFKDKATARAWWESDVYAAGKALRQACTRTEMVLVEGYAPTS